MEGREETRKEGIGYESVCSIRNRNRMKRMMQIGLIGSLERKEGGRVEEKKERWSFESL